MSGMGQLGSRGSAVGVHIKCTQLFTSKCVPELFAVCIWNTHSTQINVTTNSPPTESIKNRSVLHSGNDVANPPAPSVYFFLRLPVDLVAT
jgi:hypothetical protein